jgi:ATP-dependent Lon protease
MSKTQRDYYLREQLKQIQQELGEGDERAEEMIEVKNRSKKPRCRRRSSAKRINNCAAWNKCIRNPRKPRLVRTYLDWLVELPWSKKTKDNLNIRKAKQVLDEDHYNLEKIKERILEYLAVNKLRRKIKGPILCFVGPPG